MSDADKKTAFRPLKIGPDGWAQGILTGTYAIERPDDVLDPSADPEAHTEITEVVAPEDCAAMVAAYEAAGKPLLLVDADHSADLGASTAAYFWVSDMRLSDDGVDVLLQPTKFGQADVVEGKVYRYLSPVFPWDSFIYDDPEKKIGHPRSVTNFGLTNLPRMRGIRPGVNAARPAAAAVHQQQPQQKGASMDYKTMLCNLLKLDPATATDEQIQAASDAAMNALAEQEADQAMNGCCVPADKTVRNSLVEAYKANKQAGLNAIKAAGAAIGAAAAKNAEDQKKTAAQRVLHAEKSKTPALNAGTGGTYAAKSAAVNSVCAAHPGISRSDAYSIAKKQNPELFA